MTDDRHPNHDLEIDAYIDGRLSRRMTQVEARLENDPALAAHVERCLETGGSQGSLRSDPRGSPAAATACPDPSPQTPFADHRRALGSANCGGIGLHDDRLACRRAFRHVRAGTDILPSIGGRIRRGQHHLSGFSRPGPGRTVGCHAGAPRPSARSARRAANRRAHDDRGSRSIDRGDDLRRCRRQSGPPDPAASILRRSTGSGDRRCGGASRRLLERRAGPPAALAGDLDEERLGTLARSLGEALRRQEVQWLVTPIDPSFETIDDTVVHDEGATPG